MTLPKIKNFTDYNHYPSDPQPTTDADMQGYMLNQNDILTALTKRLWQPQTAYKLGDIVASDAMADGLIAVCTIAGVTSDIEPEWGVNEATVIDNSCTWIMRPAYCYGLATEGDVQAVHDGGSVEESRLLSVGVLGKIFGMLKSFTNNKFKDLFGENNILPIVNGGTGATNATQALSNLFGLYSVNKTVSEDANNITKTGVYHFKASITNAPKTSHGTLIVEYDVGTPYQIYLPDNELMVYKRWLVSGSWSSWSRLPISSDITAANTGGIVAASLNTNGYVKFANGLILQWGSYSGNTSSAYTITFPIAFGTCYSISLTPKRNTNGSDYCDYITRLKSFSNSNFTYYSNTEAIHWMAVGKA